MDPEELVARAHVVALPMRERFRGITVREALLIEGLDARRAPSEDLARRAPGGEPIRRAPGDQPAPWTPGDRPASWTPGDRPARWAPGDQPARWAEWSPFT